jgi:hypothetical protein
MNDSVFNLEEFGNMESEPMSTVMEAMPEGDYSAMIEAYEVRAGTSKKGEPFHSLDITWEIDAPEVKERLGRRKLTARQSMFLEVENGRLATGKGKNVRLGALREAINQNKPGWKPSMLTGAAAKVHIKPRILDDGRQFDDVTAVTRL